MLECQLKIINRLGLHARPAAMIVQTTNKFKAKIRIIKEDMEVDGKSIMGILMLAAPFGSVLKVTADGEDESQVLEGLQKIFDAKFNED